MDSSINRPIQFDVVADLYDVHVRADFDIDFFLREAKGSGDDVLELTCGTGRVSLPLLHAGVKLTCVDYSEGMLSQLRQNLDRDRLTCRIVQSDISDLSLPERFGLIFIPFHSFQEIVDRTKHLPTLERIASHMAQEGRFICTLQNPVIRLKSIDGTLQSLGRFTLNSGGTLEVSVSFSYDTSDNLVRGYQLYHICDARDMITETRRLQVCFSLFTKGEFGRLVSAAGLRVDELYGDYNYSRFDEGTSPYMIWKLRKGA